jgi:CRP-like cAMP-binding protein
MSLFRIWRISSFEKKLMCDLFRAFFADRMNGYTEQIFSEIAIHFNVKTVKRNAILTREGQYSRYLYFVNKGCLRTYHLDECLNDITSDLAFEGDFSFSIPQFLCKKPGPLLRI